jgi:hypothetical protein
MGIKVIRLPGKRFLIGAGDKYSGLFSRKIEQILDGEVFVV